MTQQQGLENLNVWRKGMDFSVWICTQVIPQFPKEEQYACSNQLRRAVQSVPANIAEGYGRYYYQDHIRFCYIARGSLEEARSHLVYAQEMGYLTSELSARVFEDMQVVRRLINGYISYLKSSKPGAQELGQVFHEGTPQYDLNGMGLETETES